MKHVAVLTLKICKCLAKIKSMGMVHGQVRRNNIIIKYNEGFTEIDDVKLIGIEHLINIENVQDFRLPNLIEHLPPDFLIALKDMQAEQERMTNKNIKSLIISELMMNLTSSCMSIDVFSLGLLLYQIVTGMPLSLELP